MNRRGFLERCGLLAAAGWYGDILLPAVNAQPLDRAEFGFEADVVIIGGGLGGCAAALAAGRAGMNVVMTEETDWIGGQLTQQAVPPDEHAWIEETGCTMAYRELRSRIRDYYRRNYPLGRKAFRDETLNPGNGFVSRLCHEPRVALAALQEMLAPIASSGRLKILLRHKPSKS